MTRHTVNNYAIIFTTALPQQETDTTNTKGIGGVAIAYRANLETSIVDIAIISHRVMHITLKSNLKFKRIQILKTYAPHMGYSHDERTKYWNDVKSVLQQTNAKQCIIWTTDNNGQIAAEAREGNNNEIGPWAMASKSEKGRGGKLTKYCYKYPLSAMGTHFTPRKNTTRNLHTWRNSVEGTYKQLDYILISNKQRNWVTQTRTKGTANINSQCQRQLILMKLRIKLKNENEHDNERKRIQFDIDMLRGNKTQLAQQISNEQIQQLLNTPGTLKELD